MPDPLEALKKAQTIGAGPHDASRIPPLTQSAMPMLPEGALGALVGLAGRWLPGMAKVAPRAAQAVGEASSYSPVAETLGEVNPEHTAVGGEGMYNAGKAGLQKVDDPIAAVYHRILAAGGR